MNNKGQSVCHVSGVPVERRQVTPRSWVRKPHRSLESGLNGLKVVKPYVIIFLDIMHLHRRFVTTYSLLLWDRFNLPCSSNCK
jgi:hypothetical protein